MDNYTIYCTEEQTSKALELGAPIEYAGYFDVGSRKAMIDFVGESGKMECAEFVIPTAEQMIGWLDEVLPENRDIAIEYKIEKGKCVHFLGWIESEPIYNSRKEATLSAIDSALEYLEKYKTQ